MTKSSANRKGPQWKEAVAGACAGATSRSIMAPVERIKLLLQLQGESLSKQQHNATTFAKPQSAWKLARTVYHEQGLFSFWRGNFPNVCRVSGTAAINFTALDYFKRLVVETRLVQSRQHREQHWWTSLVAGGLAGATSTTALYPVEFVRTRLAMDVGRTAHERYYKGTLDVLKRIFQSDGIIGFYHGYGIAVTGGIVYRVLYLGGYDALKQEIVYRKERRGEKGKLLWVERFGLAQGISLTAGTISYPFDSVRRRMMMQAGKPVEERLYRGTFHCISTIFQKEGAGGFYRGLGPNIARSVGGTILLVGYDSIRSLL